MPDLLFDGNPVQVPAGTNLVETGLRAGVPVPVFCYHRDLGAVGACRVCAVTVTSQGKSRMVMACMTAAEDGMEVRTTDDGSVAFRNHVAEWLMVPHPHDCPICDEGGECQLQDLTIACGQARRRYRWPKRTFVNQYLGEFIVHEMNRCITCYRCSRFYQEVAGGRDFGAMGSRDRVYFGRFEDGALESPFSGNLVELCPTGVFTDKLFRYKSRVWDLDLAPSVCPHCSVGCNLLPGVRYRELQRVRVRANPEVNGSFLCDRGQFGHGWVMDPARPRVPSLRGEERSWEEALSQTGAALVEIARTRGADAIAVVTSPRAALETHAALEALATGPLAGALVSHFDDPGREVRSLQALAALAAAGLPPLEQPDLAACDALLVVGASLVDEAPLAALAARDAARRGGRVFVLGPLERHLGDVATFVPAHPTRLAACLDRIAASLGTGDEGGLPPADGEEGALRSLGAALAAAKHPGILAGNDLADGRAIAAAGRLAMALADRGGTPRLGYVFPGPNGFGAAALSSRAALDDILQRIEAGHVRALVMVESDLLDLGPAVLRSLAKLELLVVADHLVHDFELPPHALLPTTTSYECDGLFVNRAGRIQAFARDRAPGIPVTWRIENARFPRQPRKDPPESAARPAWWVLESLREWALGGPPARTLSALREALCETPVFDLVDRVEPGGPGLAIDTRRLRPAAAETALESDAGGLGLYRLDRTLGSEPLSRRSRPMRAMAGPPVALVAPSQLAGPARMRLEMGSGSIEIDVRPEPGLPENLLLVPRDVALPGRPAQGAGARLVPLSENGGGPGGAP